MLLLRLDVDDDDDVGSSSDADVSAAWWCTYMSLVMVCTHSSLRKSQILTTPLSSAVMTSDATTSTPTTWLRWPSSDATLRSMCGFHTCTLWSMPALTK